MTGQSQGDQSNGELRQLTIDGGSVPHPPPRPKVQCYDCHKYITLTVRGEYHQHSNGYGEECPSSGRRYVAA